MSKFEIRLNDNGEYYFQLKARNGEIILKSDGFPTKSTLKSGIESVRKNSIDEEQFEKKTSEDGNYYFVLKEKNGLVVGTSENYTTESGRKKGINSVMNNAPIASVVDKTEDN